MNEVSESQQLRSGKRKKREVFVKTSLKRCFATTMELLAGLEPATFCYPKKSAIFRGPRKINQQVWTVQINQKQQNKAASFAHRFILELLAGLEPATC